MTIQQFLEDSEKEQSQKIAEFREYFDKSLKPKKPTMKNLDRELIVDFMNKDYYTSLITLIEMYVGMVGANEKLFEGYGSGVGNIEIMVRNREKDRLRNSLIECLETLRSKQSPPQDV